MKKLLADFKTQKLTGILLWLVIAVYTFLLPNARLAYDAIVNAFGQNAAGRVPVITVCTLGLIYALAVYRVHKSFRNLFYLIPCAVIAYLIMHLEKNPNKHIHIPEYVLMAWLLFAAFSKSYSSRDLYLLIFLCTTALGVVDELEQGIHPARFYGWSDMLVNSASGLIGIFTLMGLMKTQPADWEWSSRLKEIPSLLSLCLAGIIGAVVTCAFLFRVQSAKVFQGVYPSWLLIWNIFFLIAVPLVIFTYRRKTLIEINAQNPGKAVLPANSKTVQYWMVLVLVIVFYMYALVVYISISEISFI